MDENLPRPIFATGNILFRKRSLQLITNATGPWTAQSPPDPSQSRAERNRAID
jgi:hypothetical protein